MRVGPRRARRGLPRGAQAGLEAHDRLRPRDRRAQVLRADHQLLARGARGQPGRGGRQLPAAPDRPGQVRGAGAGRARRGGQRDPAPPRPPTCRWAAGCSRRASGRRARARSPSAGARAPSSRTRASRPSCAPKSSVSPSSYHGGCSTPSAIGADLDERALDRVAVARVLLRHLAQEARAERHVAVLVAGDVVEALDEARQRAHAPRCTR